MKTKRYIEVIDHLIDRLVQAEVENKRLKSMPTVKKTTECDHTWVYMNGFGDIQCERCGEVKFVSGEVRYAGDEGK